MEQLLGIAAILIIYLVSKLLRALQTPTSADKPEASGPSWVEEDEDLDETWGRENREREQHAASETGLAPSPSPPAPATPKPVIVPSSPPTRPAPVSEHRVLPALPVIRHPEQPAPILSMSDWLNRDGLRKAILAAEILGPCRARRPFRPGQR